MWVKYPGCSSPSKLFLSQSTDQVSWRDRFQFIHHENKLIYFFVKGVYQFKIVSISCAVGCFFWFILPAVYMSSFVNTYILSININEPAGNITDKAVTAEDYMWTFVLVVQITTLLCAPLCMARLFKGTGMISRANYCMPMPKGAYLLLLGFLLGIPGFTETAIMGYCQLPPLIGFGQATLLFLVPNVLFTLQYILVTYSALLICGSFMTKFIYKCEASFRSGLSILEESRICVATYDSLRARIGLLLLLMITKYSVYGMVDTFMTYLTYSCADSPSVNGYSAAIMYGLISGMAILILIYLCVLGDQCLENLRALLVPLR